MIATLIAWAKSLMPKPLPSPASRAGKAELRAWTKQHMPELDAELGPMSLDQVRIRLNAITGCEVQGSDSVNNGSAVFLEALKKMKGASPAPKPADRSQITRWVEQNMPSNHKNEDKS